MFKFLATYLVAALVIVGLLAIALTGVSARAEAQDVEMLTPTQRPSPERVIGDGDRGTVFVPARPRVMEVGPDGEITERQPEAGGQAPAETQRERTIRINSIEDLARLSDDDLRRLQRDGVRIDVNPFRLRDDVNDGLFRLAEQVRSIDNTFHISGVRNASGTASTGGSHYTDSRRRTPPRDY